MIVDKKLTLSVATAGVGGFVGDVSGHPDVIDAAKERLCNARDKGSIIDYHVLRCGDDLGLVLTHVYGCGSTELHALVWKIFAGCRDLARELKLYGTETCLASEFSGSLIGCGPGVAEMEFVERESEPVVIFMSNKTAAGSWNLPLYRIFADPFNTPGLLSEPVMFEGFSFTVTDRARAEEVVLSTPAESHYLLALASMRSRYVINGVRRKTDNEVAAAVSSGKSAARAGAVGPRLDASEPSMILRCHSGFPSVGEGMESFAFPSLEEGSMRGACSGPLMPVPLYEASPTRLDGPPRVIAVGFQVSDGRLMGPHDMFDDPGFDEARRRAGRIAGYMRAHGPFEPHRSTGAGPENGFAHVFERLRGRFRRQ